METSIWRQQQWFVNVNTMVCQCKYKDLAKRKSFREYKQVKIYGISGWIICFFLDMMCSATTANFSSLSFISALSCSSPSSAFPSAIIHRLCLSLTFFSSCSTLTLLCLIWLALVPSSVLCAWVCVCYFSCEQESGTSNAVANGSSVRV